MDDKFRLILSAYDEMERDGELSSNNKAVGQSELLRSKFSLNSIYKLLPLPPEGLFLGLCDDRLPVLINLHDPLPQSILMVGDAGTSKTSFLRTIALGISKTHSQTEVQFGVITRHPEEWSDLEKIENCVGIFPSYHNSSADFVLSLASWAHGNKTSGQSVVMLIDDVFNFIDTADFDTKQNIRWLLLKGANRRCWTIGTCPSNLYVELMSRNWNDGFRTNLITRINDERVSKLLTAGLSIVNVRDYKNFEWEIVNTTLLSQYKNSTFFIKEGDAWTPCWIVNED